MFHVQELVFVVVRHLIGASLIVWYQKFVKSLPRLVHTNPQRPLHLDGFLLHEGKIDDDFALLGEEEGEERERARSERHSLLLGDKHRFPK